MDLYSASVGLYSVRREILSSVTIVFYDKGIFHFKKDTIGHIFTGQYHGLH